MTDHAERMATVVLPHDIVKLTRRVDELERMVAHLDRLVDRAPTPMLELVAPAPVEPFSPEFLEAMPNETEPPFRHEPRPLPAVGQRVAVPWKSTRVGKVIGHEDGGSRVLVELPGGVVQSFEAGDVDVEGE